MTDRIPRDPVFAEDVMRSRVFLTVLRRALLLLLSAAFAMVECPVGAAERLDACGEVQLRGDCRVFTPYWNVEGREYALPDTLQVSLETELRLTGDVEIEDTRCDVTYFYRLANVEVSDCIPANLGCGVISLFNVEKGCYTWTPLTSPGARILVDKGSHTDGDTVNAAGIRASFADVCGCGCGVLLHAVLTSCAGTPTQPLSWGRLKSLFRDR
jgi:hypothetical protein